MYVTLSLGAFVTGQENHLWGTEIKWGDTNVTYECPSYLLARVSIAPEGKEPEIWRSQSTVVPRLEYYKWVSSTAGGLETRSVPLEYSVEYWWITTYVKKLFEAKGYTTQKIIGNSTHGLLKIRNNSHFLSRVENLVIQGTPVSNTVTVFNTSVRVWRRILP